VKILLDMNLSPRWAAVLADANIDATHWSDLGRSNTLDTDIMAHAARLHFVILTQDLDFGTLLATTRSAKPSVIQLRTEELNPDIIGAQVVLLLRQFKTDLEEGALITFDPRRTRVRVLPFI